MNLLGKRLTGLRKQKGFTQEELADRANIHTRTLQRIEKGETEPRGHTLNNLCHALNIDAEEILTYGKEEDRQYLVVLHLSVLSFFILPLGNIIVPLLMWLNKRKKIISLNEQGINILNFQIIWTVIIYGVFVLFALAKLESWGGYGFLLYALVFLCAANVILVISFTILISKGKVKPYYPRLLKIL